MTFNNKSSQVSLSLGHLLCLNQVYFKIVGELFGMPNKIIMTFFYNSPQGLTSITFPTHRKSSNTFWKTNGSKCQCPKAQMAFQFLQTSSYMQCSDYFFKINFVVFYRMIFRWCCACLVLTPTLSVLMIRKHLHFILRLDPTVPM